MKNFKITITVFLSIVTFATAQTKKTITKVPVKTITTKPSAVTTTYPSVIIGDQEWMSKNLDVITFRNGDPIPRAQTDQEWIKADKEKRPAWCYYKVGYSKIKWYGNPESGKYGKLYNYYAVNDPRGLAPKGWRMSAFEDWKKLVNFLGEEDDMYSDAVQALKSEKGWTYGDDYMDNQNSWPKHKGTNSSGFNALPSGYRASLIGEGVSDRVSFEDIGMKFSFWLTNDDNEKAYTITNGGDGSLNYPFKYYFTSDYKGYGHSVRCIKDIVVSPVVQEKKVPAAQKWF